MPSEGVATPLHLPSQAGFSQAPGPAGGGADHYIKDQNKKVEVCGFDRTFGGHSDPVAQGFSRGTTSNTNPLDRDSPIKTSPVSERIKALEALAAKQNDGDTWNDGGFLLFKERHYEKSSTDVTVEFSSPLQKKEAIPEHDSPESPFEVLGDTKRGNEFEDTVDWMRAHLPPVPNFGSEVPDPEVGKEASDFLLSEAGQLGESVVAAEAMEASVPDAFMDSPNEASQTARQLSEPGKQTSVEEESEFDLSFLPTAYIWEKQEKIDSEVQGPHSHAIVHEQEPPAPPAGFESIPPPSSPPASQPTAMEVKPTQMSCDLEPAEILEIDSSGESDDTVIEDTASVFLPVLSTPSTEVVSTIRLLPEEKDMQPTKLSPSLPSLPEKQAIVVPIINVIETDEQVCSDYDVEEEEDDEGYQVVRDPVKEAPQHPSQECEVSDSAVQDDSVTEGACGPSEICTSEPKYALVVQPINVPSEATAKTMADVGDVGTMDAKESLPKPVGGQPSAREFSQDPFSCLWGEPQNSAQELAELELNKDVSTEITSSEVKLLHEELAAQTAANILPLPTDSGTVARDLTKQIETRIRENSPETTSDPESIEPECSVSAATDSFVEFMRECLKSKQDEEPEDLRHHHAARDEYPKMGVPHSMSPPAMVFDVEEEHLTISALKELGDRQEEQEHEKVPLQLAFKSQTSVSPIPPLSSPPCEPLYEISASKMVEEVDMWVAEAYHLAEHVLAAILTHLSVRELVYWRDPKKSGVVFGTSLVLLLSLAAFSVISVVSYLLLALLCVTITFRIYKSVIQAVQKSSNGHPFKDLMEKDVSVPPETFRKHVDVCLSYINRALKQLSRLFLVEDLVDSLKLAVLMWLMTYVGAVFNGITILILADILLFSMPLVYEKNKTQIDHYLEIAHTQFNTIISKLHEKLPGAVKRSKVE
ncbi:hypothetical protein AAFF_G00318400 [Aldrovandia affinis]|uniref:Reticulon n=1 Tax=Aldrovandia affinis TaxID=143900 RepID=A0AAD7SNN8_9TELE|nr:hypothetical protein AAFF_G00318400 [Aldrovandia affinis]